MLSLALNYYFAYSAKKTVAIKAELYHGRLKKKNISTYVIFFKVCDFGYVSLKKYILTISF